jgi:predicted DNA-binding transcriptional regulator AlpA
MSLMTRNQAAQFLAITLNGLDNRVRKDPNFPRPFKHGDQPQSRVYYESDDLQAWIDTQKARTRQAKEQAK